MAVVVASLSSSARQVMRAPVKAVRLRRRRRRFGGAGGIGVVVRVLREARQLDRRPSDTDGAVGCLCWRFRCRCGGGIHRRVVVVVVGGGGGGSAVRFVQVGLEGPAMSVLQLLVRLEAAPLYWSAGMRGRAHPQPSVDGSLPLQSAAACTMSEVVAWVGREQGGAACPSDQGPASDGVSGALCVPYEAPPKDTAVSLLTVMLFLADMCEQAGPATAASRRPSRGSRRSGPTRRGQVGAPGPAEQRGRRRRRRRRR
jgi:hypothetical protein